MEIHKQNCYSAGDTDATKDIYYIITALQIPDSVCIVFELLMMGGETA